ncbi:MAG: hypothetical protein K2I13_02270, partial [Alistipes sp.]|nr:hypothetical protein [Alistipes sp.]
PLVPSTRYSALTFLQSLCLPIPAAFRLATSLLRRFSAEFPAAEADGSESLSERFPNAKSPYPAK